jgi:hypothetical protein
MWRPAHGATTRPGPCRPASGYGRASGRPGPRAPGLSAEAVDESDPFDPSVFTALAAPAAPTGEPDAPAPVTP